MPGPMDTNRDREWFCSLKRNLRMKRLITEETVQDTQLRFLLNETSFTVGSHGEFVTDNDTLSYWCDRFRENKYVALYNLGFQERPVWLDATGVFLYLVSDAFQKYLLRQPEIELLRDKLKFTVDEDILNSILRSVPFVPGSEYVDADWINRLFVVLHGIYAAEVQSFGGSIAMYFADKRSEEHTSELQ